jgi:hypothetical protein
MPSSSSRGREKDAAMIEGLKVQMTSEELARRIDQRIDWHEARAAEYERELLMSPTSADAAAPDQLVEAELQEHREQAGILTLLRDYLLPGEIYLLGEMDLRFADLVPEFHMEYVLPRRARAPEAS